jgi:hypothetical protein
MIIFGSVHILTFLACTQAHEENGAQHAAAGGVHRRLPRSHNLGTRVMPRKVIIQRV